MTPHVLVLRTCGPNGESHGGFIWPEKGVVEAPDWNPEPFCGGGLHGLLRGCGNGSLLNHSAAATARVVKVKAEDIVDLGGKVKFPRCTIVFSGSLAEAIKYIDAHGCADLPVVKAIRTAGDEGTATAGYWGTATAGDGGTATAGDWGTATAGYGGTATAGDRGTATAGYRGTIIIKHWDSKFERYRCAIGYVGEDGIEPNVPYIVDAQGKLARKVQP